MVVISAMTMFSECALPIFPCGIAIAATASAAPTTTVHAQKIVRSVFSSASCSATSYTAGMCARASGFTSAFGSWENSARPAASIAPSNATPSAPPIVREN